MASITAFEEASTLVGSRLNADYYNDNSTGVRTVPTRMWTAYAGTAGSVLIIVEL